MEAQKILNETEVSKLTGLALPTLRNWRHLRKGFPYLKLGKAIRYNLEDVLTYVAKKRIDPENDQP